MKHFSCLILGIFLFLAAVQFPDSQNANAQKSPTYSKEIREPSLIEDVGFFSSAQRASRDSAVKVEGLNGGHGSGTYIILDGHFFTVTARHVVDVEDIYYVSTSTERVV